MKEKPTATAKEAKKTPQEWKEYRVTKAANKKKEKEMHDAAQARLAEKAVRREEDEENKRRWAARDPDVPLSASQLRNLRAREQKKKRKKKQGTVEKPPAAEFAASAAPATVEDDLDIYENENEKKEGEVAPQTAMYVCPGKLDAQWDGSRKAVFKK